MSSSFKRNGPPKTPTALKVIRGTFRKDRVAPNEAQPKAGIPDMPPHLSAEAQKEWARISVILEELGLLTQIDGPALAAYCETYGDWVEASRMCSTADGKDRKVIKTISGNFIENPYFSIKKKCALLMHRYLTEFGMTPASRTRIDTKPTGSSDGAESRWKSFTG